MPLANRLQIEQRQRGSEKDPEHLEEGVGQDPQYRDALVERVMLGRVARYGDEAHCAPVIQRSANGPVRLCGWRRRKGSRAISLGCTRSGPVQTRGTAE